MTRRTISSDSDTPSCKARLAPLLVGVFLLTYAGDARCDDSGATPNGPKELAARLTKAPDGALDVVRSYAAEDSPTAAGDAAETLWRLAQKGSLTDDLAGLAGEWLDGDDPFVRAFSDWAISIKIGLENGGQEQRWPGQNPPGWFQRWAGQSPQEMLDNDYARLLISWNGHRSSGGIASSLSKIVSRANGAASEVLPDATGETAAMVRRQLNELATIERQLAVSLADEPRNLTEHRRFWIAARRAARPIVLANPAIDFGSLVFIKRHSAHSHRNITGSQYPWIHKPGGDICVKTGFDVGAPVRPVLDGRLGAGHVHGMDLWWDADRVVFGFSSQADWPPPHDTVRGNCVFDLRASQKPTHIYEIGLDGRNLRQLTDDPYWSDAEPTYCANGDVVFASDRSGRSSECGNFNADHTVINLYRVSADGSTIDHLNDNKDIDRYPHSLDNGLIAYTRWEYQERHFFEVHALWTMRPDGTMADAVFNQHIKAPYALRDTRSVPDCRSLLSIATGHHTFAYGPIVLIDPSGGPNWPAGIRSVTPHTMPQEGPPPGPAVAEGGVPDRGGLYQTPWALSKRCFLASYSHGLPASGTSGGANATGFSLYVLDVHGNKELIHRDPIHSCAFPIPLRKRVRPPILPQSTLLAEKPTQNQADSLPVAGSKSVCYVPDVHQGLEGIEKGTVKYLRISQRVGWPLDDQIGAMRWIPGNAWEKQFGFWAWSPARVIGTVPVEEDGSAYFEVPANEAVYFQALDENHMEVRRMRSHVTLRPGEVRGCVGCHETKAVTPVAEWQTALAMRRDPSVPQPPPWGADRLLGYESLVQPILDRHCTRCHGGEEPDGGIDLSPTRAEDGLMLSYHAIFGRKSDGSRGDSHVSVSNRFSGASISGAMEFGSHKSRLIRVLLDDPEHLAKVKLSDEEWLALVTWVDANAPYHDKFFNRRPAEGPPTRNVEARFSEKVVSQHSM